MTVLNNDIIQNIKSGDIYFDDGYTLFTLISEKIQNSKYNHTGIFIKYNDKLYVLNADPSKNINLMLFDEIIKDPLIRKMGVRKIKQPFDIDSESLYNDAIKYDGLLYDFDVRTMLRTTNSRIELKFNPDKDNKYFCSELTSKFLNENKIIELNNTKYTQYNPCDFEPGNNIDILSNTHDNIILVISDGNLTISKLYPIIKRNIQLLVTKVPEFIFYKIKLQFTNKL